MRRKILLYGNVFICAVLTIVIMVTALPTSAAAAVVMKVRPGLGGLYKANQPLELLITVENSGPEFDGMLRVKPDEEQYKRPDLARYSMAVKVPADASEQYHMMISGELAAELPVVELVAGDYVLAKSRVEGAAVGGGGQVILALSEEIMGSGVEVWLSKSQSAQWNLKYLSPGELPADSLLLGSADVIMIDPSNIVSLTGSRARALKEWVQLGGVLTLFGGAGASEGGLFADISPVCVTGEKLVDGKLAGLRSGGPLNVASGELVAGKAVALENGVPVLARREFGRGQVLYCGAVPQDLGSGAQGVWSTLLGGSTGLEGKNIPFKGSSLPMNANNELTDASSYLPWLAGPPIPVLVLLWLLYVAAAGPLLYFLLRRVDRRDWAWALLPAMALAAAGFIYLLAPAGRLQNFLSQTVATVEIFTPELAEVRTGTTVVVARGGDLTVQAADKLYAVPVGQNGNPEIVPALIHQSDEKVSIDFNNVEYGSLRKISAYGLKRDFGSIEGKLYLEGSSIKGDLSNKTGLDLRESRLLLGGRVVKIGDLPAGGTVHIEETLERWNRLTSPEMLLIEMGSGNRPGDPYSRERQILSGVERWGFGQPAGIQFLGWHDGAPGIFEVTGKPDAKEDFGLVLVKQAIEMDLTKGQFRLPAGFIKPRSEEIDGSVGYIAEEKMAQGNHIKLIYDIEDAGIGGNFRVERLDFQAVEGQYPYLSEIYNRQQDKWEPLPTEGRKIAADEISQYLVDNKVTVRLTRTGEIREPYQLGPGLAVEGVVS